ncbi:transposase [Tunicatimonas pelagia]|uniref:transposase n=1 Tax=Tunicatimonas pelagia TaxID=931531 RepID=UPI00266697D6|nr:transposase [Tunicatimonas pelagia]WKN45189.1 transposase [Tunicatimonas pelagia]
MNNKYQDKYRIASARASWWNYGWNGAYFVTICTENREHFFGKIHDGQMQLSRTGVVADILWHQIPYHAPFVELGDFVVMPNHVHGIIILDKPGGNTDTVVETLYAMSLPPSKNQQMADISPRAGTLSTVVRSYKSAVTRHANRLGLEHG